jgi:hypothetical protein
LRQFSVTYLSAAAALLIALSIPGQALERRLTIVNGTTFAIAEFYAANVATDAWPENRLGNQPLPAGASRELDIDDGTGYCLFNLRAVFEDGDEIVSERVNICDETEFYYRP